MKNCIHRHTSVAVSRRYKSDDEHIFKRRVRFCEECGESVPTVEVDTDHYKSIRQDLSGE